MTEGPRLVGAALVRSGHVLLGLRSDFHRSFPSVWDFFGGHVEQGESFEEGLRRELAEELGIVPEDASLAARTTLADGTEYRIFKIERWAGGEPAICNAEHSDLRWFSLAEACALEPLASPAYRALFPQLLGPSPYGHEVNFPTKE